MAWNVVIAGGGFGGFYAARTLDRVLPANSARIRVVNDVNFMLYTPLLPGAAAGTLEPRHVVVPLREQLSRVVDLRLGRILGAAPERNKLLIENLEGEPEELAYDHLIVTVGSVSRTLPVPGLAEHAVGFKSLAEAISLRNHVLRTLEMAETLEDGDARREHLTYVFVGAGYAGLEGIAELQDFVGDVLGALSALSRDRDALGPRRGQRSRHARDRPEARRVRDARAARARDRDPHEHHARRGHG
ncbi:MAG: FAD-dependent oxidoreductase, partial [Actinomycetota bacterium]|nr:FAD-dependent oxidoreductase [Actinomycetota bacterium]